MSEAKTDEAVQDTQSEQPVSSKKNNNKNNNAPKAKVKIKLTGAGSYNNLNFNLGLIKKGEERELEADMAEKFLASGLFERV